MISRHITGTRAAPPILDLVLWPAEYIALNSARILESSRLDQWRLDVHPEVLDTGHLKQSTGYRRLSEAAVR
jgi:hypothetical protein